MIAYLLSALAALGLSATPEKKASKPKRPQTTESKSSKDEVAPAKKPKPKPADDEDADETKADPKNAPDDKPVPRPKEPGIRPGSIQAQDLKEYAALSEGRKRLIDEALKLAAGDQWIKYVYGSSEPSSGGLDCSGSMYYLMQHTQIDPPRTSGEMFRWVKDAGKLTEVPSTVTSLDDPAFDKLQPGDLLFWSGTTGGDDATVSHVQMFMGHEASDGLAVMAGASDGRTYRGKRRDGYGIFDFRLPAAGTKARFLGYGAPPDLKDAAKPPVELAKNDPPAEARKQDDDPPAPARKKSAQTQKKKSTSESHTSSSKTKKKSRNR